MIGPACDPRGHCITCSDEGVPMRVLEVCADGAMCVDDQGVHHDRIAIELIEPVAPGAEILVHAGVAIR